MIWVRRSAAVLLAILFIMLFVGMLFLSRINATLGNPGFYTEQLRKADVYNFVYDQALPRTLDEIEISDQPQDIPFDVNQVVKEQAVPFLKQVLPPQWIQARVEDTIAEVMPYFLGDTEQFAVAVPLKDRLLAAQKAVKDTLHKGDTFANLYDQMVTYAVDQASAELGKLPFKLTLTRPELESLVRKLVPQDWLLAQMDKAIDQVFPYLAGDADHFVIRLDLKGRASAAGEVAIDILSRPEAYDYIFDQVVAPEITRQIAESVPLPFGITLTNEEVTTAIREILPQPWFKARLEDLVNQAVPYLEGESDTITVAIPLADQKAAALRVLDDLAHAKLESLWQSLPEATLAQVPDILRSLQAGQLPPVRLPGLSYQQLRQTFGIVFTKTIGSLIIALIPNQVEINQAGLSQLLSQWDGVALDRARQHVTQGWTYTDVDLQRSLGTEATARLEDVRSRIKSGFTFTQVDIRQRLQQSPDGTATLASIDQMRHSLGNARGWLFTGWILLALLLVAIGALGARKLRGKIAWAAAALGVAALGAYIAAGPVYGNVARPELVAAMSQAAQEAQSGVASVAMDKASQIAYQVADTLMRGIKQQALIALIVAHIGVALFIALPVIRRQQQSPLSRERSKR